MAPKAAVWNSSVEVKEKPLSSSPTIARIYTKEPITIIKHYEEFVVEGGKKMVNNWFYVKTKNGKYGYVPSNEVGFIELEHANILNKYYLNPPLSKQEWTGNGDDFLMIKVP